MKAGDVEVGARIRFDDGSPGVVVRQGRLTWVEVPSKAKAKTTRFHTHDGRDISFEYHHSKTYKIPIDPTMKVRVVRKAPKEEP